MKERHGQIMSMDHDLLHDLIVEVSMSKLYDLISLPMSMSIWQGIRVVSIEW